ncbi:hypothetical protein N9S22_01045 [Paracoccaceae bacterium]|nr:hypothetical protein [Paracoccaceae bacterium]
MHNLMLRFAASLALLIVSAFNVSAEIEDKLGLKFYGSFLYTDKVPNALFFFSDIEKNDSFELRKALRNHDIDILVLSSKGGSVWEGLNMAGIIYDKELITYVPKLGLQGEGTCASACAFMFFGGSTRIADGKLGVHQFYSGSASESAKIGTTQKVAQFTVSEIIGFLNEFKTPPFVYERMFQQSDMYYFDKKELEKIGRVAKPLEQESQKSISSFINDFRVELASLDVDEDQQVTEPVKTKVEIVKGIQTELSRLNCNPGPVDGKFGRRTRIALSNWKKVSNTPNKLLVSEQILKLLKEAKIRCANTFVKNNWTRLIMKKNLSGSAYCIKNGRHDNWKLTVKTKTTQKPDKSLTLKMYFDFNGWVFDHTHTCFKEDICYGKFYNHQKNGYLELKKNSIIFKIEDREAGSCVLTGN